MRLEVLMSGSTPIGFWLFSGMVQPQRAVSGCFSATAGGSILACFIQFPRLSLYTPLPYMSIGHFPVVCVSGGMPILPFCATLKGAWALSVTRNRHSCVSPLAPAMACALPNAQLTVEEHACGRQMKGHCTGMGMPATHSCCRQNIDNHFDAVQPQVALAAALSVVAVLRSPACFDFPSAGYGRVYRAEPSPPISPAANVSVLRI